MLFWNMLKLYTRRSRQVPDSIENQRTTILVPVPRPGYAVTMTYHLVHLAIHHLPQRVESDAQGAPDGDRPGGPAELRHGEEEP